MATQSLPTMATQAPPSEGGGRGLVFCCFWGGELGNES